MPVVDAPAYDGGMPPGLPHAEVFTRPLPTRTSPETLVLTELRRAGAALDLPHRVDRRPDAAVVAHVNHGRWLVECPLCGEAQYAGYEDRRFLCISCYRLGDHQRWRPITWPTEGEVVTAEALLRPRPRRRRNWHPARQPLDHLARENAVRGLTTAGVSIPAHVREAQIVARMGSR